MIAFLVAFLCLFYHSQDVFVLSQTSVICALYLVLFWIIFTAYENGIYHWAKVSLRAVFDVPFPRLSRMFRRGSGELQDDTSVGESKA